MLKPTELVSSSSSGSDSQSKVGKIKVKEEKACCSGQTCEEAEAW